MWSGVVNCSCVQASFMLPVSVLSFSVVSVSILSTTLGWHDLVQSAETDLYELDMPKCSVVELVRPLLISFLMHSFYSKMNLH